MPRTLPARSPRPERLRHRSRQGFTLIELSIAMSVLLVAISILAGTVTNLVAQRSINRENSIAANAARVVIERMRGAEFEDVFALYNADVTDDFPLVGEIPGHRFGVQDLDAPEDSPDGLVGEVFFPSLNLAAPGALPFLQLREDIANPELGMPRDLNGDSIIDDADHGGDYVFLPVRVRLRWVGSIGPREYSMSTALCRYVR